MKRILSYSAVIISLGLIASTAFAQTTAPGPYYATPSWDQQLPTSTRFIVLSNWGNAAVLDRETGLVWEKSPSGIFVNWNNALRCNQLSVGNRKGWRLPTIQELASLVDADPANTSSPRLPPGHPFQNVQSSEYWSASSVVDSPTFAWGVDFSNGRVTTDNFIKTIGNLAWCVRGGQGVDPQ